MIWFLFSLHSGPVCCLSPFDRECLFYLVPSTHGGHLPALSRHPNLLHLTMTIWPQLSPPILRLSAEAAPLHLSCLLLVTDEHGTILGIDLLMDGAQGSVGQSPGTENLAPRAYALLCHSMACPMGSGDPRKPRQLTVGDAHLHRYRSLVPEGRRVWDLNS